MSKNVNTASIPAELKDRPQWMMWRKVQRGHSSTKVPYQPDGKLAKSNDASTWSSFDTVLKALQTDRFDGIGFAFADGDGLAGIDLDHCFQPDGNLKLWAQKIVDEFGDTYIEKSPSGDGLHIWCFGKPLQKGARKWKVTDSSKDEGLEVYDHSSPRYFTVTGSGYNAGPIRDCQSELEWLYAEYFAEDLNEASATGSDGRVDLDHLNNALSFIPADDYWIWLKVGMAIKSAGLSQDVWVNWSRKSEKYAEGECEKKWKTFHGEGVKVGSIYHIAKCNGFSADKKTAQWDVESFGEPILFDRPTLPEITSDFLPMWVKEYVDALALKTKALHEPHT